MKHYMTKSQTLGSWLEKLFFTMAAIAVFTLSSISPAMATGVYDLDSPNTGDVWVVDQSNEISRDTENKLTGKLKELADATGQEFRIVAIRRLDYGETINSFADEVFSTWYPDAEAQSNKVLLVMDTLTNTTAIRRGSAAAELVDTEVADSVVNDTVGFNLRKGNKYNQALLDAGDRLGAVLSGEADPGPPAMEEEIQVEGTFTKAEDTDAGFAWTWVIILLVVATVVPMVTYFWYVL